MTSTEDLPLPSPPFFSIPNINNLRDGALHSGGLTTPTGKIRPGILFRSAETSKLDREGWRKAKEIGIGHVFDLRSKPEIDKGWKAIAQVGDSEDYGGASEAWEADMKKEGVERSWVPVFEATDYGPERLAGRLSQYMGETVEGFVHAYHDILSHAGPAYRTILLYLTTISPPSHPSPNSEGALIHCTAGKDRTGMFFGILFSYLGVPHAVIAEEYNLTEAGLRRIRNEVVGRLVQSPGMQSYLALMAKGRANSAGEAAEITGAESESGEEKVEVSPEVLEIGRQAALRMLGARKETMIKALEMVDREWGSAEGYLRGVVGLGDEELEALRRNLVIEEGA